MSTIKHWLATLRASINASIEQVLPLGIWAIGLAISFDHIRRRSLMVEELAPVSWLLPALFDLLVIYAAYVLFKLYKAGDRGWGLALSAFVVALGLSTSMLINVDYVQPANDVELILTLSVVVGSFLAFELWRVNSVHNRDEEEAQALSIEQALAEFKERELPRLLQGAHQEGLTKAREEFAHTMDAAPEGLGVDELEQRRTQATPPSTGDATLDTLALLEQFEAQGGDRADQTEAIKFIRAQRKLTYGPAHRRYKGAMAA